MAYCCEYAHSCPLPFHQIRIQHPPMAYAPREVHASGEVYHGVGEGVPDSREGSQDSHAVADWEEAENRLAAQRGMRKRFPQLQYLAAPREDLASKPSEDSVAMLRMRIARRILGIPPPPLRAK